MSRSLRLLLILSLYPVFSWAETATQATAQHPLQTEVLPQKPASEFAVNQQLDLLPIPVPDLTVLEKTVAVQLTQAGEKLQLALAGAHTSNTSLAVIFAELGRLYHAYELYDSAEACYRNAWFLNQVDLVTLYLLGYLYQNQGRYPEAIKSLQFMLDRDSRHFPAWIRLGDIYRMQNQPQEATSAYRNAGKLEPQDPALLSRLGEIALDAKRYREAVDYLTRALQKQPAANRLHYSLAMAWRGLGESELARQHLALKGDVGIRPADPLVEELAGLVRGERVHLLRGKLAFSVGRYQEAADAFAAAYKADPKSSRALVNLAATMSLLGRSEEAELHLYESLQLQPNNITAHFNLGLLAAGGGDYSRAEDHLQEAISMRPDDPEIHIELADVQRKTGHENSAFIHYAKAVTLDSGQARGWLGQADMFIEKKRYTEAIEKLKQANRQLPTDGQIAHKLARLLAAVPDLTLRDGPGALDLAQRVFKASSSIRHAVTLAMAFAETGACEQAANLQRQVLEKAQGRKNNQSEPELARLLKIYENRKPCRYPGEVITDPSSQEQTQTSHQADVPASNKIK